MLFILQHMLSFRSIKNSAGSITIFRDRVPSSFYFYFCDVHHYCLTMCKLHNAYIDRWIFFFFFLTKNSFVANLHLQSSQNPYSLSKSVIYCYLLLNILRCIFVMYFNWINTPLFYLFLTILTLYSNLFVILIRTPLTFYRHVCNGLRVDQIDACHLFGVWSAGVRHHEKAASWST